MICPCYGCEFRHRLCHAKCEPYNMWREEKRLCVEAAKKGWQTREFVGDAIMKQRRKLNRKKRK